MSFENLANTVMQQHAEEMIELAGMHRMSSQADGKEFKKYLRNYEKIAYPNKNEGDAFADAVGGGL